MTLADAIVAGASEQLLEEYVRQCANLGRWRRYHTRDSRRSPEGFPDEVLAHGTLGLTIFAELKGYDTRRRLGKLTAAQWDWLTDLRAAGQFAYLWTPHDADLIERILIRHQVDDLPPLGPRPKDRRRP